MQPWKFIPTFWHGVIDYGWSVLLLWAPTIGGFDHARGITWFLRGLALFTIFYSVLTRYELGFLRYIPMRTHLAIDAVAGLALLIAPFALGYTRAADSNVWGLCVLFAFAELGVVLFSQQQAWPVAHLRRSHA